MTSRGGSRVPFSRFRSKDQDEHVVREVFAGCHARAALPAARADRALRRGAIVRESAEFSGAIRR